MAIKKRKIQKTPPVPGVNQIVVGNRGFSFTNGSEYIGTYDLDFDTGLYLFNNDIRSFSRLTTNSKLGVFELALQHINYIQNLIGGDNKNSARLKSKLVFSRDSSRNILLALKMKNIPLKETAIYNAQSLQILNPLIDKNHEITEILSNHFVNDGDLNIDAKLLKKRTLVDKVDFQTSPKNREHNLVLDVNSFDSNFPILKCEKIFNPVDYIFPHSKRMPGLPRSEMVISGNNGQYKLRIPLKSFNRDDKEFIESINRYDKIFIEAKDHVSLDGKVSAPYVQISCVFDIATKANLLRSVYGVVRDINANMPVGVHHKSYAKPQVEKVQSEKKLFWI